MDGFSDSFGAPSTIPADDLEADPAAEFLAREQEDLAGLEDDVKPVVANGLSSEKESLAPGENEFDSGFEMVNHSSDIDTAGLTNNGISADYDINNDEVRRSPSPTSIFHTPAVPREEPEKIRRWREDQEKRLQVKDEDEEKRKTEMREAARKELDEWYNTHDDQVAKNRNANRSAEKELVADTEPIEPGTEWERIAKLCDFNPKASKHTKDISRMRSIILQVKQTPPVKQKQIKQ